MGDFYREEGSYQYSIMEEDYGRKLAEIIQETDRMGMVHGFSHGTLVFTFAH
jgi:hypothetical protein